MSNLINESYREGGDAYGRIDVGVIWAVLGAAFFVVSKIYLQVRCMTPTPGCTPYYADMISLGIIHNTEGVIEMRLYTIDLIACGERLGKIQEYLKKTNGEMASLLDISPDYYRSVKRGDSLLTIERAAVLYDKYNIDLNYLYFGILVNGSFVISRRNDRSFESFVEEGMILLEADENKNHIKRIVSYLLRVTERLVEKI